MLVTRLFILQISNVCLNLFSIELRIYQFKNCPVFTIISVPVCIYGLNIISIMSWLILPFLKISNLSTTVMHLFSIEFGISLLANRHAFYNMQSLYFNALLN